MPEEEILSNIRRELAGVVGVDAGKIIVCDPGYMDSQQLQAREEELSTLQIQAYSEAQRIDDVEGMAAAYPLHYSLPYLLGNEGAAVISHSGIGDGVYPVYVTIATLPDWGERVVRLEVDFLEHAWLETVPLEMPDAIEKLLNELKEWLPTVHSHEEKARVFVEKINSVLEHYERGSDELTGGEESE